MEAESKDSGIIWPLHDGLGRTLSVYPPRTGQTLLAVSGLAHEALWEPVICCTAFLFACFYLKKKIR